MSSLAALMAQNPATHYQVLHSMMSAGAHGAARSAWIEINRPLTALAVNCPPTVAFAGLPSFGQGYTGAAASGVPAAGVIQTTTVSLPIGMDIKSITCVAGDVDAGWLVLNFTFGTLNLVNPQGQANGINLSMFDPRLEHVDRLAPWILSKTKVDVQVMAQLQNFAFGYDIAASPVVGNGVNAVFHGFSLNAFQEEQVCAIQTRIEPTDRNVGNAELITHFRQTIGMGLGLQIPAYTQASAQIGRVATLSPASIGMVHAMPLISQIQQQPSVQWNLR